MNDLERAKLKRQLTELMLSIEEDAQKAKRLDLPAVHESLCIAAADLNLTLEGIRGQTSSGKPRRPRLVPVT